MTHLHVICSVRIMRLLLLFWQCERALLFDLYSLSWEDLFPRKMVKYLHISIPDIFEVYFQILWALPQLWVVTPLTRAVQALSDQHQICLNAEHSLSKAQQKILMAGFGPASCSFPYQAKGNAAHIRNCRNRVSAGGCHQCQQNYTPRELKTFKAVDIFKAILRGFKGEHYSEHLILPFSKKSGKSKFQKWVISSLRENELAGVLDISKGKQTKFGIILSE